MAPWSRVFSLPGTSDSPLPPSSTNSWYLTSVREGDPSTVQVAALIYATAIGIWKLLEAEPMVVTRNSARRKNTTKAVSGNTYEGDEGDGHRPCYKCQMFELNAIATRECVRTPASVSYIVCSERAPGQGHRDVSGKESIYAVTQWIWPESPTQRTYNVRSLVHVERDNMHQIRRTLLDFIGEDDTEYLRPLKGWVIKHIGHSWRNQTGICTHLPTQTRMASIRCLRTVHQCFKERTATDSVIDLLEQEQFMINNPWRGHQIAHRRGLYRGI
ncbi:hypothetical protein EDD15DRAFT_2402503 [Pisolithus albus]|nr:hypothetical protein EDD15DRAFT_2402503 [Pisolithus albus]